MVWVLCDYFLIINWVLFFKIYREEGVVWKMIVEKIKIVRVGV